MNPHERDYCNNDLYYTIESCKNYYEQEMLNNGDWNFEAERLSLTKIIMKYLPSEDWKRCFYKKDLILENVEPCLEAALKRDILYSNCHLEEVLDSWLEGIIYNKKLTNFVPTTMS